MLNDGDSVEATHAVDVSYVVHWHGPRWLVWLLKRYVRPSVEVRFEQGWRV
jgi:hypothetical protein